MSINYNFEVICLDDSSTETHFNNSKISSLEHCSYIVLDKNIGRSAIRNKLANMAQYEYLLFIDSDMLVIEQNYIENYLKVVDHFDLVYGGISYKSSCIDDKIMLRWKYGIERESLNIEQRNLKPYLSAKFCNLLIRKDVFSIIQFDEKIKAYGHEDTLFSLHMQAHKLKFLHIDNQLLHDGLEDSKLYLDKVDIASKNLRKIAELHNDNILLKDITLLKMYYILKKFKSILLYRVVYSVFKKGIERNLLSSNPNIRLLDFYKLNSICNY
jgi:hypothetical protein